MDVFKKLREVIPKQGIIYNERKEFPEAVCKPKILPLKSFNIRKLEELEKEFEKNK